MHFNQRTACRAHLNQEAQALRPPHARRLQHGGSLAVLVQQVGVHIGAASKWAMAGAESEVNNNPVSPEVNRNKA